MAASRMTGVVIAAALVAATGAGATAQQEIVDGDRDQAALARFHDGVTEYLGRHRIADSDDLETLCLPDNVVVSAPRLDVPGAPREGEIFVPEVASLFRRRLAAVTLGSRDATPQLAVMVGVRLGVGRGARLPKPMAAVLPALPDELEYRIVGRDLVLVDVRAHLVVDALRDWRQ